MISQVKGMSVHLPEVAYFFRKIENVIQNILDKFNYQEIKIPCLEKTELFLRSIGNDTDIVNKEMYSFFDRNKESITLRPEGTAGCARAALDNGLLYNQISINTHLLYYCYS